MKIIRITTNNEIDTYEYPEGDYSAQDKILRELIGPKCDLFEHVEPQRLYTVLGGPDQANKIRGDHVSMLADEEGLYHDLDMNMVGSILYGTDIHGYPVVGNILIIGEAWSPDGIEFCGISEERFNSIYSNLKMLTKIAAEY